jgi:hypothetical protein
MPDTSQPHGWTYLDGPVTDSPQVERLMSLYDRLDHAERRQMFLTLTRGIYASSTVLDNVMTSLNTALVLDTIPAYRESIRTLTDDLPKPGEGISFDEAITRLRS